MNIAARAPRYAIALAAVAAAVAARVLLTELLGPGLPTYITFYPMIMFVAMAIGTGPGMLTAIASAAAANFWRSPPYGTFAIEGTIDVAGVILFISMGVFISLVAGRYRTLRDSLEELVAARTSELEESRRLLERRVLDRTTELERAHAAAEAERRRLYVVLETLPAYVVLLDGDYRVPFANRFFRDRFGESRGKRCYEYLFGRSEPCENCETFTVMKTGERHHWEWAGPDGRAYDVHDFPFVDSNGDRLILEMGIDISEQKTAQDELRKHRDNLEALVADRTREIRALASFPEKNPNPIIEIDFDGAVIYRNPAAKALFPDIEREGLTHPILAGASAIMARLIDGSLPTPLRQEAVVGGECYHQTITVIPESGRIRLYNAAITERKRMEEEIRKVNENLDQFAYIASHDLQEPLRILASYSQLLLKRYQNKLDADADDFIGFIVQAANRMQSLITDLLAYSRTGHKGAQLTEFDCDSIARRLIETLAVTIELKHATVTHDRLPVIRAHRPSILQLFQNLLSNALRFTGDAPPVIHIGVTKNGTEHVFSVRDNGIGIEPQYHERIFQIFQRLHSRDKFEGTGMGLTICKRIVENHGGRIWVESEPGAGSVFHFTIPENGGRTAPGSADPGAANREVP